MKKAILSLVAALACGVSSFAAIDAIVINAGGDEPVTIALSEKPTVKVSADALVITTESGTTYTYETTEKISFAPTELGGIEAIVADKAMPTFYFDNSALRVYNLEPNSMVALYGINGVTYFQGRADAEGNLEVDLSPYHGVIIVNTVNKSIKINKK